MAPMKALVVGGTSGIGRGIAEHLAKGGNSVCIAGRSESTGATIVSELKAMTPGGSDAVHSFKKVDCFDLDNVKSLAKDQAEAGLDFLVLTQGMATIQGYTPTKDNFDQKLCLHFYSRVVLAQLLAPTLAASKDGRVLSVLSAGVHGVYSHFDTDPTLENNYSIKNAADAAGMYNDVALAKLAEQNPGVNFTHAAPGFVSTNWGTEMPLPIRWAVRALQIFGKSPAKCADDLVSGWMARGKGAHFIGQNGQTVPVTPIHDQVMNSGFWADTQARLSRWLE